MRLKLVIGVVVIMSGTAAFGVDEVKVGGGGASIATVFKPLKPYFEKDSGIRTVNLSHVGRSDNSSCHFTSPEQST